MYANIFNRLLSVLYRPIIHILYQFLENLSSWSILSRLHFCTKHKYPGCIYIYKSMQNCYQTPMCSTHSYHQIFKSSILIHYKNPNLSPIHHIHLKITSKTSSKNHEFLNKIALKIVLKITPKFTSQPSHSSNNPLTTSLQQS